jgi:AmmeMemoRadiSam system protein A
MNLSGNAPTPEGDRLLPAEKDFLRDLAWRAVQAAVRRQPPPAPRQLAEQAGLDLKPRLLASRGAFVTLTAAGRLRGCIGYIEGHKPLVEAVVDNGRSAAVGDPRFAPVSARELDGLEVEVSVLTPLAPVGSPEDIEIGRQGVVLAAQGRRAVFLPQVATEQGWDLETTLGHLAVKAGLAPNAWQEDAQLLVFEAEVF